MSLLVQYFWFCLFFILVIFNSFISCQDESQLFGQPDTISEKEIQLVAQLRKSVENIVTHDYMKTDEYLIRFLRVRNNDLRRAKEMIEKAMKWRKENNIDNILLEDFSLIESEFPVVFDGVDNFGRPVIIVSIGVMDFRKIVVSGHMDKFLRLFNAVMELAEAILREIHLETGHNNITRAFAIFDLARFNLRQHACIQCVQMLPRVFTEYENYYPDRFHRVYTVNTPPIFLPVFELIRPFLSEPSRKATKLFDYDSEKWKKALLKEIPPDQLPTLYGGNRTVTAQTLAQLKKSNPYVKAAFEKATKNKTS